MGMMRKTTEMSLGSGLGNKQVNDTQEYRGEVWRGTRGSFTYTVIHKV